MNVLSAFFESEVLVRDADDGHRYLIGIAVPWDVPTPVDQSGRFAIPSGTAWESFERGALDKTLAEQRKGMPLFGGKHPKSAASETPAAVLTSHEVIDGGHLSEWRLFRNYQGQEATEMAEARVWTGFSLGYAPVRTRESSLGGRKHFVRQEVRLDHVAFLRNPAYDSAELLAMRAELEDLEPAIATRARTRLKALERRCA